VSAIGNERKEGKVKKRRHSCVVGINRLFQLETLSKQQVHTSGPCDHSNHLDQNCGQSPGRFCIFRLFQGNIVKDLCFCSSSLSPSSIWRRRHRSQPGPQGNSSNSGRSQGTDKESSVDRQPTLSLEDFLLSHSAFKTEPGNKRRGNAPSD
jgi:hypothetical protein